MFKRINDLLALIVIVGIPLFVAGVKVAGLDLSGEAVGTFVGGWLLVIQFFFRKSGPNGNGP